MMWAVSPILQMKIMRISNTTLRNGRARSNNRLTPNFVSFPLHYTKHLPNLEKVKHIFRLDGAFPGGTVVKNMLANARA